MPHNERPDAAHPADRPAGGPASSRATATSSALGHWPDPMDGQLSILDGAARLDAIAARLAARSKSANGEDDA